VLEIPTLIPDMRVRPLEQPDCLVSSVAALLPPRDLSLGASQPGF
jgi:hypothetical protein